MYEVWAKRIMLDVLRDIVLMRRLSILFIVCFTILLFIKKKEEKWFGLAILSAFAIYLLYVYRVTGGI